MASKTVLYVLGGTCETRRKEDSTWCVSRMHCELRFWRSRVSRRGGTSAGEVVGVGDFLGATTRGEDHTTGVPIGDFAIMRQFDWERKRSVTADFQ